MLVKIDSVTLDILSLRLKSIVSPMHILQWLNNFEENEVNYAVDFIKSLTVFTSNEIEEIFNYQLDGLINEMPNGSKAVILPVGDFGKSGSMMGYLIKKTSTFQNNGKIIKLIPNYKGLSKLGGEYKTLILIDDFVGSGMSIKKFWKNSIYTYRSKFKNIVFFGISGMEDGIKNIVSIFDNINIPREYVFKKAFSNESSFFKYRKYKNHREVAYKYGKKLTQKNIRNPKKSEYPTALGFSNSQSLVSFFYGTPNNSLPIFWAKKNSNQEWIPLIPRFNKEKISIAQEFRKKLLFELSLMKEMGSADIQQTLYSYEVNTPSGLFSTINHVNFSLYAILKLIRQGFSEVHICHKLGISYQDYVKYLNIGIDSDIFDKDRNITLYGLELLKDATKCVKKNLKYHYEFEKKYDINEIGYVPKLFNGKS